MMMTIQPGWPIWSPDGLLAVDRALRGARQRAFPGNYLADLLWEILIELESRSDSTGLVSPAELSLTDHGGSTLERCIAVLVQDGLVDGVMDEAGVRCVRVRLSRAGQALIDQVLVEAANEVSRLAAAA